MTPPIIIRGVEYPDKAAIAAAFGISIPSVRNAIRLGRTEFIGIPAHKTRKRTGTDPMPMRIAGKVYPDAHAAAKALKVSVKTIYSALSTGREDFVGLGRKRKHRRGGAQSADQAEARPDRPRELPLDEGRRRRLRGQHPYRQTPCRCRGHPMACRPRHGYYGARRGPSLRGPAFNVG